jgi:ribonuclease-3
MAIGKDFNNLIADLGYEFFDTSYLENALTHASYSNEYKSRGLALPSNERLEFLGDAVLQIIVSEYLYDNFKQFNEGKLTLMRQQLVCERTLAGIAKNIKLGEYIHLGKGEEAECRHRPKVLANTLEAVIGAVFTDCRARGSEDYKAVIINLFEGEFANAVGYSINDYKTLLQKLIEKDGGATLEYEVTAEEGPDHDKIYTVVAKVNNNVVGMGSAGKKRDAEMSAAKMALELFGIKDIQ